MSLLTTTPVGVSPKLISAEDVFKRFLRDYNVGEYGTATGGDIDTLIDSTLLKSNQYSPEQWERAWILIVSTTDGNAPYGESRPVRSYYPETGEVSVDPPFTAPIAAGDRYVMMLFPHPLRAFDFLNDLLKEELNLPDWAILTEMPDGDMEAVSVTADWTAVNVTATKETTTPWMEGKRWMKGLATAANGYIKNANPLIVVPGQGYHLSALCRCHGAGDAKLVAWDLSNNLEIASTTVSSVRTIVRPYVDVTAPAGCEQMEVRLQTVTSGESVGWDSVCFFALGERQVSLPLWVRSRDAVKAVYRLWPDEIPHASGNLWRGTLQGHKELGWNVMESSFNWGGQAKLMSEITQANVPLFIFGVRHETAFSHYSTDLKAVDIDWAVANLAKKITGAAAMWPGAATVGNEQIMLMAKNAHATKVQLDYQQAQRKEQDQAPTATRQYGRNRGY